MYRIKMSVATVAMTQNLKVWSINSKLYTAVVVCQYNNQQTEDGRIANSRNVVCTKYTSRKEQFPTTAE
jgi:hypothetical protein